MIYSVGASVEGVVTHRSSPDAQCGYFYTQKIADNSIACLSTGTEPTLLAPGADSWWCVVDFQIPAGFVNLG